MFISSHLSSIQIIYIFFTKDHTRQADISIYIICAYAFKYYCKSRFCINIERAHLDKIFTAITSDYINNRIILLNHIYCMLQIPVLPTRKPGRPPKNKHIDNTRFFYKWCRYYTIYNNKSNGVLTLQPQYF